MRIDKNNIDLIAKQHRGVLRANDLISLGFNFKQIKQLTDQGTLVKVDRGIYRFIDAFYDERVEISRRIPNGIFCLFTAAFIHELSDFVPSELHLAIPKKARYKTPDYPPVKLYYWETNILALGVIAHTINGQQIKVFDSEKTVCDMFRLRSKVGEDVVKEIVKTYLSRADRDIAKLYHYAKLLKVEKPIHQYLTILL